MNGVEKERRNLGNILSGELFFLNGEKIDITFHDKNPPDPMLLNFISSENINKLKFLKILYLWIIYHNIIKKFIYKE